MDDQASTEKKAEMREAELKICGIIMPISPHADYPADHWKDVLAILLEAVRETEFDARLVSEDAAIGLIHDRIVRNIYSNEIVICDVSSKNPNVMFELGLRLAFDKPTIIIKDELTGYSFDTGVIEHIPYPSSLSFKEIVRFKAELINRIDATYKKANTEPHYSPFLKSFGNNIIPAKVSNREVPERNYVINMFEHMRQEMQIQRMEQKALIDRLFAEVQGNKKNLTEERAAIYHSQIKRYEVENEILRHSNQNLQMQIDSLNKEAADKLQF